ncbi:MAG: polyprenol phosphomannose-dependent alpha 1,6 mannosyltransferase MptB [Pseudonocardia sp.]
MTSPPQRPVPAAAIPDPARPSAADPARPGGWLDKLGRPPMRALLLGLVGGLLLVLGGVGGAGVLVSDPVLSDSPFAFWRYGHGRELAIWVVYIGLALITWAWVLLGRAVLARKVGGRGVLTTSAAWLAPIVFAPPLFTRDPFSYLAQGALQIAGFDPYAVGPAVLLGPISDNVHAFWQNTPANYGPLFVLLAKAIMVLTGSNLIAGVIVMRLAMMVGLVLLVWATPGLVRHLGGKVALALWIVVANPLMVIHLVGGPHNDLLVIGLLAAGCLLMLDGRHVAGIVVVSLGIAIKVSIVVALPFLVLVWAARLTGTRPLRITKAAAAAGGLFVATFAAATLAAGVGLGWLPALNAPTQIVNWLSLPTGIGELVYGLTSWVAEPQKPPFIVVARVIGVLVLLVIAWRQWWAARDGGPDAVRRAGLVLVAVAVLSPTTLPWYVTWGMALLAMGPWSPRALSLVVFASVWLVVVAFPDGESALYQPVYLAVCAAGALLAAISLRRPDPLGLRGPPAQLRA